MTKPKCIVCGRRLAHPIKFPAGSVNVCTDNDCLKELNYKLNSGSVPVVWFSLEDLKDRACKELLDRAKKNPKTVRDLATTVSDYLWNDNSMGDMFHEACDYVATSLEEDFVTNAPATELPLFMEQLVTDEAIKALETRLGKT